MKYLKIFGLAAVAAMAFMAFAAGASATTLKVGGVQQNGAVKIEATLESGTSAVLSRTDGSLANTCTSSTVAGTSEAPFTGATVTGALTALAFESCTRTVTVHKKGVLHVEHASFGTNGTVSSSGAEVTVGSPFGTLNCKTGSGVDVGLLTGDEVGHAKIHVNAVLDCGFLVPSASWKGTYVVTSPTGLGVMN